MKAKKNKVAHIATIPTLRVIDRLCGYCPACCDLRSNLTAVLPMRLIVRACPPADGQCLPDRKVVSKTPEVMESSMKLGSDPLFMESVALYCPSGSEVPQGTSSSMAAGLQDPVKHVSVCLRGQIYSKRDLIYRFPVV